MFGRWVTQQNHLKKKSYALHSSKLAERKCAQGCQIEGRAQFKASLIATSGNGQVEPVQFPVARKPKALAASEVVSCLGVRL